VSSDGRNYLCPICCEHGYHNHSDSEITGKAFSLRLKPILERAEKAEAELASLRARVAEYLAAVADYDRRNAFDVVSARACDAALDRVRAEVQK
jgi:hypothetical protein